MCNLYCGDCIEVMQSWPEKSIDMVLCDLPYGVTANKDDVSIPFDMLWEQYERITKENAAIVLFAQGLFYVDLVQSNRKMFRYDLVWDKRLTTGFLNAKRMPLRQHEQIAVFYKKSPTYNPQYTEGIPLHSKGKAFLDKEMKNQNYGRCEPSSNSRVGTTQKYPKSILSYQKPHSCIAKHRTAKPVELLEYLVCTYTNKGDTVLDNCMGSGSTGIACLNTGRNFVGIEKNIEIFQGAKAWLEELVYDGANVRKNQ